jgi:uncharacterized protein
VKVVINTSPLILLSKIDRLRLLENLFEQVLVPRAVIEEIEAKPGVYEQEVSALIRANILEIQACEETISHEHLADLGDGEHETISLALETSADLVIMDDQEARRIARHMGLQVTGTIGVLIEARERKLIASIRKELDHLIEVGMWLDEVFYHRILKEYNE